MQTILCIGDHLATLQSLSLILQFAGYNSLMANTPSESDRLLAEKPVDLVVIVHGLPGIDGTRLAEHLKNIKDVRVVLITVDFTLPAESDAIDELTYGPIQPPHLLETIAKLLPPRDQRTAS